MANVAARTVGALDTGAAAAFAVPTASGPASRAAQGQPPATIQRSYLPAPPPISIRPAPVSGPPIPAAARAPLGDQTPATIRRSTDAAASNLPARTGGSGGRQSLLDTTADLFRSARLADAPIRRFAPGSTGGNDVPEPSDHLPARVGDSASPAVLSAPSYQAAPTGQDAAAELRPHQLDEIVERVIDKIEQRVVDELERRGRRFNPGVF